MKSKFLLCAITIMLLSFLNAVSVYSQSQAATTVTDSSESDSLNVKPAQTSQAPVSQARSSGEIVLEEIKIEAIIETPSVAIVPKRLKPDFGKMEFIDRSFEKELKAIPKKPMLTKDDLNGINKIKKGNVKKSKNK